MNELVACACGEWLPGHDERLKALGLREIAYSFDDVRQMIGLACSA